MGRLDIAMKQLMNDYDVFADTFNFRRAAGKKILPSSLCEMDPSAYVSDVMSGVSSAQSSDIARQLVVRGDVETKFGGVAEVMRIAERAGVRSMAVATKDEGGE